MREFTEGDRVVLRSGFDVPNILYDHKGSEFIISKVVVHDGQCYYELDGCDSRKGVPFGILTEWLKPSPKDATSGVMLAVTSGGA